MNSLMQRRLSMPTFGPFNEMDQLMNVVFGNFGGRRQPDAEAGRPVFVPRMDIRESEGALEISADLPGFSSDEVRLDVLNNVLTVKAEKNTTKEEQSTNGTRVLRSERVSGSYLRRIALPVEVDGDKAEATFSNGVLTVTLPKAASHTAKPIAIKAA